MATYVTIPEVTDAEELLSFHVEPDGKNFNIMMKGSSTTVVELMQGAAKGTLYPLVVIATDGVMMALDNVYVTSATFSGTSGGDDPDAMFGLQAEEVRVV